VTGPTITALVRAYNAEAYIGQTIEAILTQTRRPEEVLVVDDGSTDGTSHVLERFEGDVRVVRQVNSGLAAAFNRGFAEARGDYVAICDADDIWRPDKLERQYDALRAASEIDVAFGAASIFGAADGSWGHFAIREPGLLERRRFANDLFRTNVVTTSTVIIRRSLFAELGRFEEHLGAEDYDYWLRAVGKGATFYYDPSALTRYRRHDHQVTSSMLRVHLGGYEVRVLRRDVPSDRRLVDEVLAKNLFQIGRLLVDEDRPRDARAAFQRSARHAAGAVLASAGNGSKLQQRDERRVSAATAGRASAWVAVLSLPAGVREGCSRAAVDFSRMIDHLRGGRPVLLP
jgi:glycosyltransferase involved in cell wall biosynthesis